MKTRKDSAGRKWEYNDAEGTYSLGPHVIGCGGRNGSRFMFWDGPKADCKHPEEFSTLKEAMDAV